MSEVLSSGGPHRDRRLFFCEGRGGHKTLAILKIRGNITLRPRTLRTCFIPTNTDMPPTPDPKPGYKNLLRRLLEKLDRIDPYATDHDYKPKDSEQLVAIGELPDDVLRMRRPDVVILFDMRQHEPRLTARAERIAQRCMQP